MPIDQLLMFLLIAEDFWLEEVDTIIQKRNINIYPLNYFDKGRIFQ